MTHKETVKLAAGVVVFWALDGVIFELTKRRGGGFIGDVPPLWKGQAVHVPPSKALTLNREEAVNAAKQQIADLRQILYEKEAAL